MIKVYCPRLKYSGGPGVFMKRLLSYMQDREMINVVEDGQKFDVYFCTIWLGDPPPKSKIVYRAASVYFDAHERKRKGVNKKIVKAIRSADHVVYQSRFAKKLCEKVLTGIMKTKIKARKSSTIVNGFDINAYSNVSPIELNEKKVFISIGDWERKIKRGSLIVKAFEESNIPNSELLLFGKVGPKVFPLLQSQKSTVKIMGQIPFIDIVSYLKSDIKMMHLCYLESCPNSVIEALSFGCPVLCNNIGATPEIVGTSGIICECDRKFPFKRHPVDLSVQDFKCIVNGIKEIADKKITEVRDDLSMEKCANSYLNVFKEVLV